MAPQNNKFEYFFDLPPELRELILSHICVFPAGILVGGGADGRCVALRPGAAGATQHLHGTTNHNHADDGSEGHDREAPEQDYQDYADPPTNLFLASPVLHREAGDLYYGRNTFHLPFLAPSSSGRRRTRHRHHRQQQQQQQQQQQEATTTTTTTWGGSSSSSSSDPGTAALLRLLTHADTAGARRRVRAVVVTVRRIGAQLQDVVVPALAAMVLEGVLRRVRVDVVGGPPLPRAVTAVAASRGWMARDDLDGNPALRALLVLLADPGLEGAALRVLRVRHAWFWCRFHQQQQQQQTPAAAAGGLEGGDAGRPLALRPCALLGAGASSLLPHPHPPSATAAATAAAARQEEGGVGDGFLEVDINRLVEVVCAGDAAEFNIKKV